MEMSVMVHMRQPWNIPEKKVKIFTVGKKNYVACFYSYKTQRVDKTIRNYKSKSKFSITLVVNVQSEKFAQIIRYQPSTLKILYITKCRQSTC